MYIYEHSEPLIQEVRAYWQSALDSVRASRSDAPTISLLDSIDAGLVQGVHEPTSGMKKTPGFEQMREWKRVHPTCIILMQARTFTAHVWKHALC